MVHAPAPRPLLHATTHAPPSLCHPQATNGPRPPLLLPRPLSAGHGCRPDPRTPHPAARNPHPSPCTLRPLQEDVDAEWIRQELYEFGDKAQQPPETAALLVPQRAALASWGWLSWLLAALRTRHELLSHPGPRGGCGAAVRPDQSRRFCGLPNTQADLTVNVELLEKGYGDGGGGKVNMAPGSGKLDL